MKPRLIITKIILISLSFSVCFSNEHKEKKYTGLWPYNPNKDTIVNPGFNDCPKAMGCECSTNNDCPKNATCEELFRGNFCIPSIGAKIPRLKAFDQHGELFDLYDLAYQDKPIIIEISTPWPRSSNSLAAWRSYINENIRNEKWWRDKFDIARDILDNDGVYWVQIMHLNENKNPIEAKDINSWVEKYPHDKIIVLSDPEANMKQWIRPTGYPCLILLEENMRVKIHALRGVEEAFDGLFDYYNIEY